MTFSDPENPFPSSELQQDLPDSPPPQFQPHPPAGKNIPEDIRTSWGGGELLLLLGFAIGSAFVLDTLLELFLIAHYHLNREQLLNLLKTDAPVAVGFQAVWSGIIFLFLFLMIRQYNGVPFWSSLRWRLLRARKHPAGLVYAGCILSGIILAIFVSGTSYFAGEKNNLPIEQLFGTRADVIWLMIFAICVAPFFEETIFRGYLYPVFARKMGIPAGIIITGVLFGLMHAVQLWGGWTQIGLLALVGIILTVARARTGSVLASYLIHLSYNSFLFSGFLISTHGLKTLPK